MRQPSEEEIRALEAEMEKLTVDDVLLQTIVSLLNLGGRRAGIAPGTEGERDLEQVRTAIEAVRVLLPLVQDNLGRDAQTLRDALSQLQIAYAQLSGAGGAPGGEQARPAGEPEPGAPSQGEPQAAPGEQQGPAQRSGRLWIPGQ
jgi:hypothetical protein